MSAPAAIGSGEGCATSVFNVPTLHCAGCIAKLEGGLAAVAGVIEARVNFTARRVRVTRLPELTDDAVKSAIERLGFPAEPFLGELDPATDRETRALLKALAVAGFASMNVMLLSVSVWSGADGATRQLFHWLSAAIALPAVGYSGRTFFGSALAALRHGRTNMDVPISIGVLMACAISVYETATWGPHAYFDGAVTLLFFLLAGRTLDAMMRARAQDGVAALLRQTPAGATVLGKDGATAWRRAEELAPGMRMIVAAGDRLAADGVVEAGRSAVDRALITGESLPERVGPGSAVLAGTINVDGALTVRVTAAGEATAIADIARMMEAAAQGRSRYVRIADRAARFYAPAVHTLAALSFALWITLGAGVHQSVLIAVAVLIITCPCALGLAVPVAQVVAVGALMRRGVLVKDGAALERLAEVDVAFFDKTGTLTLGRPTPVGTLPLSAAERPIALALAQASRHPLSRALAAALAQDGVAPAPIERVVENPGLGVAAESGCGGARLGRPDWMGADDATASLVAAFQLEDRPTRILVFEDAVRPDAASVMRRMEDIGVASSIVSGDREAAVRKMADALDIGARSAMTPGSKVDAIRSATTEGHRVLMVGDGLNDAPALKAAHVSIAPSSASDVGQQAADLVVLGDSLESVPVAIAAARRTLRVVRQNIGIAVVYNVVAIPLAFAGHVTPLVAALAMSGSSLLVVGNATRLRAAAR
ncbi:heavy metal translocating P-type ATPase [Sphingomonas floccifaciens]|uniref:Heavy metal translocating P-type ATPase n=1 Tax=Sphingomonas floccifaciens TaxID=1844115 RepID=A0ABW4NCV4_9SPHN